MTHESKSPQAVNYFLQPGYIYLATQPTTISTVLGSCVSVCIYDRKQKIGGVNHFYYPYTQNKKQSTAKYGNVSTITLIRMMQNGGSKNKHLEAQILGGAHNIDFSSKNVGHENYKIAKKILTREHVTIVSEDVGGVKGRKIVFNTETNEIAVVKVDRLRKSDWYPYEGDRF
jgi:chemotaxis protein CheD